MIISLVCPFYNEEEAICDFFARLKPVMDEIEEPYEVICVNDGSSDGTLAALLVQKKQIHQIKIIDLSRNFGKEAALTAALDYAIGDAVIPIDADLQDPPDLIPKMLELWHQGAEVVVAHRADRLSDSWLKRTSAFLFYRIHNKMSETPISPNVGDFRLMDRKVVEAVRRLPESRRFMKGVFAWVGFRTVTIDYVRAQRSVGKSKFSGWRLWNFALEGITSFSTMPLRVWLYAGVMVAFLALGYASVLAIKTLLLGVIVPGYASLIVSILFLAGVQLIGIGVLGEYIGRIYMETKQRPIYIVRQIY